MLVILLGVLTFVHGITAHVGAYGPGMYCRNGFSDKNDPNTNVVSNPLYNKTFEEWWLHGPCKDYPPPDGEFLDLPAGGNFKIELATNRAETAYFNNHVTIWPDGKEHDDLINHVSNGSCITDPNLHSKSEIEAAGTAFAIAYTSDINTVTMESLAIFSVLEHTPWRREVYYDVPKEMPPCPEGGCICAWGWVPNGCGEPNEFQNPFRCQVTGAKFNSPVAVAQPPVWCQGDDSKCVKGAKQMVSWNQKSPNNVQVPAFENPSYNENLGFKSGAQNDIFVSQDQSSTSSPSPTVDSKEIPTSSSDTPPASSDITTTTPGTRPSGSCPRSPSKRANLVKKSSIASHKRLHARR